MGLFDATAGDAWAVNDPALFCHYSTLGKMTFCDTYQFYSETVFYIDTHPALPIVIVDQLAPLPATQVPEPASLAVLGAGIVGLGVARRFWKRGR